MSERYKSTSLTYAPEGIYANRSFELAHVKFALACGLSSWLLTQALLSQSGNRPSAPSEPRSAKAGRAGGSMAADAASRKWLKTARLREPCAEPFCLHHNRAQTSFMATR
eukprot:6190895-Pleurochrysis_carterae.AAC.3